MCCCRAAKECFNDRFAAYDPELAEIAADSRKKMLEM